jgi:hypothetical protein
MTAMPPLSWTTIVILLATTSLIVYDFYAAFRWGVEGTLSYEIVTLTYHHPVVAFAGGFLCGHLFWNMNVTIK